MPARSRRLALAAAVLAVAAPAASAHPLHEAPQTGEVTIHEPFTQWTGEAAGSVVQLAHHLYEAQLVDECDSRFCDEFLLTVGPGAKKLEIGVEDPGGYTEVQIRDEAGNEVFFSTGDADVATVWRKKNPPAGKYLVEVLTDALAPAPAGDASYEAYAKLDDGIATPLPDGPAS